MKKRHFLFCLLLLYIVKNYVEIASPEPVDENFWVHKLSSGAGEGDSTARGRVMAAEGIREIAKLLTVQEKQGKAMQQTIPGHDAPREALYDNTLIAGVTGSSNYGNDVTAYLGSSEASSHGPSAGYDAGSIYSVPSSTGAGNSSNNNGSANATGRTMIAANAQSTASAAAGGSSNAPGSAEGSDSYTIMDDPGGPLLPPDDNTDDPGGPLDPPVDNVPLDGGISVLLAAGVMSGLRTFKKKRMTAATA